MNRLPTIHEINPTIRIIETLIDKLEIGFQLLTPIAANTRPIEILNITRFAGDIMLL
jgi:hypothetical protein